jgi:hypothetical protein
VGVPLKDWGVNIYRGVLTGYNEAFIVSGEKKDELIAIDPKSAEIIRPILRGRDIKRYDYSFADLWLIATFPSRKYDIELYQSVKKHLLSFGLERLEQTGRTYQINGKEIKGRKKTNNKWFETQDSISYWDDFSKQKITWGNLCLNAQYALVEDEYFVSAPAPMIVPGDKYLLAVLNSKVADFYIRNLGVTRNGGYFEYKPMFVEKLPVPQLSESEKLKFSEIVDQITDMKRNGRDIPHLDSEIDNMVYNIFEFSNDEINLISTV